MKTSPKAEFRRIFRETFVEAPEWTDWFVDKVYRDDDLRLLEVDDSVVSMLLMSRYEMDFHGATLPVGYLSCVATPQRYRGKGYMTRLLERTLNIAAEEGYALCALIPSSDRLYFFYDKFGFSTVYYVDEMRYTALHSFAADPEFVPVKPEYELFSRLERLRPLGILHTRDDFRNILRDNELDKGHVIAVEASDGRAAMAFVTVGEESTVRDLLSTGEDASETVLAAVRQAVGDKPIVVRAEPGFRRAMLRSRGMVRIADVMSVLTALAASNRAIDQVIRVHDPIISANNAIYIMRKGECVRTDETMRRITLDVTVDVLARIIFSTPSIADIFGLPGGRPLLPLMLD